MACAASQDEVILESDGPLKQCDRCPYGKGKFGPQTGTQGERPVNMKADIGVMLLQAKKHRRLPTAHQNLGEGHAPDSSSALGGTRLPTPGSQPPASGAVSQYLSMVSATPLVVLGDGGRKT